MYQSLTVTNTTIYQLETNVSLLKPYCLRFLPMDAQGSSNMQGLSFHTKYVDLEMELLAFANKIHLTDKLANGFQQHSKIQNTFLFSKSSAYVYV